MSELLRPFYLGLAVGLIVVIVLVVAAMLVGQ